MANGVISGTPTTEGATATFKAAPRSSRSDTHRVLLIVVRQPLKVAAAKPFATVPLPTLWEVGVPFSGKLTPSGGSGTYTFTLAAGSLPTGLALAADGTVAGTPRAAGVYRATLRLADSEGRTTDYAANFGVAARLAVSTLALRPGKVGRLYRAKVASTGGVLPRKWKILKGPAPQGSPVRSGARHPQRHADQGRSVSRDLPGHRRPQGRCEEDASHRHPRRVAAFSRSSYDCALSARRRSSRYGPQRLCSDWVGRVFPLAAIPEGASSRHLPRVRPFAHLARQQCSRIRRAGTTGQDVPQGNSASLLEVSCVDWWMYLLMAAAAIVLMNVLLVVALVFFGRDGEFTD